jgi:hypothetical protein
VLTGRGSLHNLPAVDSGEIELLANKLSYEISEVVSLDPDSSARCVVAGIGKHDRLGLTRARSHRSMQL